MSIFTDGQKVSNTDVKYWSEILKNPVVWSLIDMQAMPEKHRTKKNDILYFFSMDFFWPSPKRSKKIPKTKLIHISTDEVYGDILFGRSDENYPYKPSSPYAASKASSDHLVSSYVRTYNIPAIVTNCSNNYGPKQHPEKLIPKLIYNILQNKPLPIYGKGTNSREWIYVKDHCEALIKIFKKGKKGNFYNIGSNKNQTNLEICKKLIQLANKNKIMGKNTRIKFVKDRPGHDIRYALNSSKLKNELRWSPRISLSDGLKKTFEWYRENSNYYKSIPLNDIRKRLGKTNK